MLHRLSFVAAGWHRKNTSKDETDPSRAVQASEISADHVVLNTGTKSDALSRLDMILRRRSTNARSTSRPSKSISVEINHPLFSSNPGPALDPAVRSSATARPPSTPRSRIASTQNRPRNDDLERIDAFSRSSPDLTTDAHQQPWPSIVDAESSTLLSSPFPPRRPSSDLARATPSLPDDSSNIRSRYPRSPAVLRVGRTNSRIAVDDREEEDCGIETDDEGGSFESPSSPPTPSLPSFQPGVDTTPPSPIPRRVSHRPTRSMSPQPTESEREAARAATLSKLVDSLPFSTRISAPSTDSVPFPSSPSTPPHVTTTRGLPPIPFNTKRTPSMNRASANRDREIRGMENEQRVDGSSKARLRPRHHSASAIATSTSSSLSALGPFPSHQRSILLAPSTPSASPSSSSPPLQSQTSAIFDQQRSTEMVSSAIRIRLFLEQELGSEMIEQRKSGVDDVYDNEIRLEEGELWSIMKSGVVLCLLINHLFALASPIPPAKIDLRRSASSHLSNISIFLAAVTRTHSLPPSDLFLPSDLLSGQRSGFRRVLHTLSVLQNLHASDSNDLCPPSPLPSATSPKGRGSHGRDGSASTDPTGSSPSDADSSIFTNYSFNGGSISRSSRAVRSALDPAPGANVTFIDRVRERDRDKEWGAPVVGRSISRNKVYGSDRRMSESTIDVMTVVEEDESPRGFRLRRSQSRHSQPVYLSNAARGGSTSSLALNLVLGSAPTVVPRRDRRYDSVHTPNSSTTSLLLDSPSGLPTPRARQRHSSDAPRPTLILGRSLSHSAVSSSHASPTHRGPPISIVTELSRPASSRTVRLSDDPTYSTALDTIAISALLPRAADPNRSPVGHQHHHHHQRWNSELTPVGSDDGGGRSRKQSLVAHSRVDAEERRALKTKLVLREDGRQTLTYQLGECIGRGQFGSVYRALNLSSGRVVAVKRIGLAGKSEEDVLQLSNEIEVLKDLSHPGVVSYEGVVRTENYVNIILEYVENGSLQKTLKHFGELPEGLVASYVVKILEGLDYLHSKNVVHCDLKCANILSTKNGNVKLSDFGVSLNLNAVQNLKETNVNDVNGTPNWMAPEVIQMKGASTASDIWSLACTIVELITGKPPYDDLNSMSAMYRIVDDDCPPIPPRCSIELSDFLTQCFAKDPAARPSAVQLFDHVWLQKHWNPYQDLRAQDSIPFLRRINTDARRSNSPLGLGGSLSPISPLTDLSFFAASPLLRPTLFDITLGQSFESATPRLETALSSADSTSRSHAVPDPLPSSMMWEGGVIRPHSFLKSTFSKAVQCKLCQEPIHHQANLCETCGLIVHQGCISRSASFLPCIHLRTPPATPASSTATARTTPRGPTPTPPGFQLLPQQDIPPLHRARLSSSSSQKENIDQGQHQQVQQATPALLFPDSQPSSASSSSSCSSSVSSRMVAVDLTIEDAIVKEGNTVVSCCNRCGGGAAGGGVVPILASTSSHSATGAKVATLLLPTSSISTCCSSNSAFSCSSLSSRGSGPISSELPSAAIELAAALPFDAPMADSRISTATALASTIPLRRTTKKQDRRRVQSLQKQGCFIS